MNKQKLLAHVLETKCDVGLLHLFINGLELDCSIGVHPHERLSPQPVRIDIQLTRPEPLQPIDDDFANVICYEALIERIKTVVSSGHVNLVETLAERIADGICSEVPAITRIKVKVCKLAVFDHVSSVGVELERSF